MEHPSNRKFNMILATDSNYGISKNNMIPWNIHEDMKFFKEITSHYSFDDDCNRNTLIMGKNTADSLGKPLPNRHNILITSGPSFYNGFIITRSLDDALQRAQRISYPGKEVFVIGGSRLYNESLTSPYLDKIFLTYINKNYNCDNHVEKLLDRDDMVYTILDKKTVLDKNSNENVDITFYMIIPKKRHEEFYQQDIFDIDIEEKWYDYVKNGEKIYEVFGNTYKYGSRNAKLKYGDIINFKCEGKEDIKVQLCDFRKQFRTFEDMIKVTDVKKIYPLDDMTNEKAINYFNNNIFSLGLQKAQGGVFLVKFKLLN